MMGSRLKRGLIWALYTGAMLVVFALLTFPYEQLQTRVLAELSRTSGWTIGAEKWALAWPFGLEWQGVNLSSPGSPSVKVDRVKLALVPSSLLQRHPSVMARVESGEGPEEGRGYLTGRGTLQGWSRPILDRLTGTAERFDLGKLGLPGMKRGLLKGDFDQHLNGSGEGQWQVEFTDLQLESVPVGPAVVPLIRFASLKGRAQCREKLCRIESFTGTGPDGTLSGSGTLGPRQPAVQSELALAVTVTISPEFAQRAATNGMPFASPGLSLTVNLRGPVSNLQLAL